MGIKSIEQQATIFSHYLLKQSPSPKAIQLYKDSVGDIIQISSLDRKLFRYIEQHPLSIGFIDAALPLYSPHSEVRRRLYLMLAILEASPEYYRDFLPVERKVWYIFFVTYSGIRAVLKAAFGSVLVRIIGRS